MEPQTEMRTTYEATDPDSERLPLVEGGQGRTGKEQTDRAFLVGFCLAAGAALLCAVFAWGRYQRAGQLPRSEVIQVSQ